MDDKTIYQKYDELLEANTRLPEEVSSMKFTAGQQAYLERVIEMNGLDIIKVRGSIYGHVEGNVNGSVKGHVDGDVEGDVKGAVWGSVEGNVKGHVKGNVKGDVWGTVAGKEIT